MATLLSDSEEELEVKFNINKNYADRYDSWRRKEELQKFKDRFGEDALEKSEDDSSSSSSDDDDLELPMEFDKEFYHTLSSLKSRDPKIYDKNTKFFDNVSLPLKGAGSKSEKKSKPMFLRDYERKVIQEGGLLPDEDEEVNGDEEEKVISPSYFEEQDAIKESFKGALNSADDDEKEEQGIGGLFSKKVKSQEELEKEEDDYSSWLLGNKGDLEDAEEENKLSHLRSYWTDPKLDPGEAFLRDYILKKKFKPVENKVKKNLSNMEEQEEECESDQDDEITDGDLLEQEEKEIEKMEEFEHKFNFRFEEPDQEFIKRFPRTLDHSLRKKDDKRKQKREELRTRKETEKQKLKEQLGKAKELKQREIEERLKQLCNITGNENLGFEGKDLDEDFDPAEYDKRMKEIFSEDAFYGVEDNVKPVFPSMDEELDMEDWDTWGGDESYGENTANQEYYHPSGESQDGLSAEDPNFNMDCDYDPKKSFQEEMMAACGKKSKGERGKGRRWRARQSRLAKGLLKEKPQFDPMEVLSKAKLCQGDAATAFEKYVDEYYGLEYEDIIGGDLPCRFKYRKVIPNDFGLSVEEILSADDKELNRWCSLKKAVQIRPEDSEKYDLQAYRKKSSNFNLKKKVFRSIYASPEEPRADEEESQNKKSKKNKHKQEGEDQSCISQSENANGASGEDEEAVVQEEANSVDVIQKKKKKRKRNKSGKFLEYPLEKTGESVEKSAKEVEGSEVRTEESDAKQISNVKEKEMEGRREEKRKKKTKDVTSLNKRKKEKGVKAGKIKKQHGPENYLSGLSKSRLKAYGINPKKFGNKLKYKPSV
ncbi:protein KRI1 homolog [Ischnura elegans]|uniref:protein KRI1 homolog n=1 Tax=Ischnura elegans TaxID=197161 RepID=UPI001ED8B468|nr:protein KRI1 homolog [Ischnura elegans]